MLLETGLVSELPKAVGTLQRPVTPGVGGLHVIVQEPLLGEVLATIDAHEGTLARVHAVVHVLEGEE